MCVGEEVGGGVGEVWGVWECGGCGEGCVWECVGMWGSCGGCGMGGCVCMCVSKLGERVVKYSNSGVMDSS